MWVPPILVINLDHRTDKWEEIKKEFKDWPIPLERVSAIKYDPPWKGCYMSHLKCIKIAKERNYPWVLYVEDDCVLMPGAKERFLDALPYLWDTRKHWDFFMGGLAQVLNIGLVYPEKSIVKAEGYGAHFCLVNSDAFDRILDIMEEEDPKDIYNPCDCFFKSYFRLWTRVPFIAKQRPGLSDICNVYKDSYGDYDEAETLMKIVL